MADEDRTVLEQKREHAEVVKSILNDLDSLDDDKLLLLANNLEAVWWWRKKRLVE